jgi:hypothetical protein
MSAADSIWLVIMSLPALSGAALGVVALREILRAHGAMKEAETRAALLESALVQERQKRSRAVSKGNRTRAERQRQKVLETAAEVRAAVELKKLPPQGALFPPAELVITPATLSSADIAELNAALQGRA